jgi:hypothetical protein
MNAVQNLNFYVNDLISYTVIKYKRRALNIVLEYCIIYIT